MISARRLTILAIVGALLLGISACRPGRGPAKLLDECVHDAQCLEGLFCCDDTCHECCEDYDCDEDAGERCSDEHRCVKVGEPPPPAVAPAPLGADCERVRCQEGLHCCDDAKCHECCYPIHCDKGEDCQGYKCVPWENYPFPPPAGSLGTDCDTDPDCLEGLHCCDDAKCHKCCYDPHCAQNEDCVDYWCVPVAKPESEPASEDEDQTATEPEPEEQDQPSEPEPEPEGEEQAGTEPEPEPEEEQQVPVTPTTVNAYNPHPLEPGDVYFDGNTVYLFSGSLENLPPELWHRLAPGEAVPNICQAREEVASATLQGDSVTMANLNLPPGDYFLWLGYHVSEAGDVRYLLVAKITVTTGGVVDVEFWWMPGPE